RGGQRPRRARHRSVLALRAGHPHEADPGRARRQGEDRFRILLTAWPEPVLPSGAPVLAFRPERAPGKEGREAGVESLVRGIDRRELILSLAAAGAAAAARPLSAAPARASILEKPVQSSGEKLPLVGLGSWITFNVGDDPAARDSCAEVMRAFFQEGGRLIDSSPMYGSSQEVIGYGLARLNHPAQLFSADKVWTSSGGAAQIEESRKRWGVARFDLLEVHNLLSWEEHLPKLFKMKAAGRL